MNEPEVDLWEGFDLEDEDWGETVWDDYDWYPEEDE